MSEPDVPYPKKPIEPYRGVPPKTLSPPVWSPDHPPNIIAVRK